MDKAGVDLEAVVRAVERDGSHHRAMVERAGRGHGVGP